MPENVVIGLKTLRIHGHRVSLQSSSTPIQPAKRRVFTEDEWNFLNSLPSSDLARRIRQGEFLIRLLHSPQMMNTTQKEADRLSSNLKYQIEAIQSIIDGRPKEVLHG